MYESDNRKTGCRISHLCRFTRLTFFACLSGLLLITSNVVSARQQPSTATPSNLSLPSNLMDVSSGSDQGNSTITDLVRRKRWSELLELAQQLAVKSPTDPNPFYWQGIADFQMRKPVNAVQAFRIAEKLGLDNPLLHEALGLAYYDLNQFVLFEEQMELASHQDPKDFAPAYYLGLYRLSIRSDPGGALTYFNEAVQLNPSDWKSLYQQGYALELIGNSAEARQSYLKSIQLVEENRQPFGWPYQGMARLDAITALNEALLYAKKAVDLEPDEPSHHFELAKLYEQTGDFSEGIKEAQITASQDPNHAAVRYLLFRLYRKAGDTVAANSELKLFQMLNAVYGPE